MRAQSVRERPVFKDVYLTYPRLSASVVGSVFENLALLEGFLEDDIPHLQPRLWQHRPSQISIQELALPLGPHPS